MLALDLVLGAVTCIAVGVAAATVLEHRQSQRLARHSIDVCAAAQQDATGLFEHTRRELDACSHQAVRFRRVLEQIEHRARARAYAAEATDSTDEALIQIAVMARDTINVGRKISV